jgi:hypothetical protein
MSRRFSLKDYGYRVSNLIRYICENEKWKIGDPFVTTNLDTSLGDVEANDITPLNFITNNLVRISKKDKYNVGFIYHCTPDGVLVRLKEINIEKPTLSKKEFNFMINGGNYGNVLSFTPNYNGLSNALLSTESGYVDRVTNQFTMFKNNPNIGDKMPINTAYLGASSVGEFTTKIQSQWLEKNLNYMTANMEIVGDPDITPMDPTIVQELIW